MTVTWNQWRDTAANIPQAGQIRSTEGNEVVRAKRPWGTHKVSAEKLDERRSPADVAANRQSLQDLRASLTAEYGDAVAQGVYQQLFQGKEARGRPISSAEILVADGLAKELTQGRAWLLKQTNRFDADIAKRAFQEVLRTAIPLTDGVLTSASVAERIEQARDLAVQWQTERGFEISKGRFLELFAATPATATQADGTVSYPREVLRQQLLDMIDAPLTRAEVPGDTPSEEAAARSAQNKGRVTNLAERHVLLSSLVPSADQLQSLATVDSQAAYFDVVLTQERQAAEALKSAQVDLAGWRELAKTTPAELVKAQGRLEGSQAQQQAAQGTLDRQREALKAAVAQLSVAETAVAQRGLNQQLLRDIQADGQARMAELEPFKQAYSQAYDRLAELETKLRDLQSQKPKWFNAAPHQAKVAAAHKAVETARPAFVEAEQAWKQKMQELSFREAARLKREADIEGKLAALPVDESQALQDVERCQGVQADAQMAVQGAEQAFSLAQAQLAAAQDEVALLQSHLAQIPVEIASLEQSIPQLEQQLEAAREKVIEFHARARPDLRDMLQLRADVLALERGRFPPSELSTAALINVSRFVDLKLVNLPPGDTERSALATVVELVQDELLARVVQDSIEAGRRSRGVNAQVEALVEAGEASPRVTLGALEANLSEAGSFRDFSKFLRGGTSAKGLAHPHPALLVARALSAVRQHELTPQAAAQRAMAGSSLENQMGIIRVLEARERGVAEGTLEPRVFDEESKLLLEAARNHVGMGDFLHRYIIENGSHLDALLRLYYSAGKALDNWSQAKQVQQDDVQALSAPAPKPSPVLSALRALFAIGRGETARMEAAKLEQQAKDKLNDQIQRAIQNVQTSEEKIQEATDLSDRAKYALRALANPDNEAQLKTWISQGFLVRDNKIPSPKEVEINLRVLREVPEDILVD